MFDVDFRKLLYNLYPHFLRKAVNLAWVNSMVRGLETTHGVFKAFRDNINYKLQFTGQVNYLERVLNDQFDPIGRAIFIEDTSNQDLNFLFNVPELEVDMYVFNVAEAGPPLYLVNQLELEQKTFFIVNIPAAIFFREVDVRALVDTYRQAGKPYLVETF